MKIGEQTIVFLAVNKNGDEVILNNDSIDGVKIVKSENGGTLRSRQNTSSSKNFIKLQI